MAATTMHFGPEWMRTKHQPPPRNPNPPPSPPPSSVPPGGASTYSALVSPAPPPQPEKRDETHPFRYSKDEMLRIYKDGGGKGGLGLEVERWEGVVREVYSGPISLREMGEAEKKLFEGPLNSELCRRQSTDFLSSLVTPQSGDRPRLNHAASANSPMRERFGSYMGKRRDSTDHPPPAMPRKPTQSSSHPPVSSPRDTVQPSRSRSGFGPGFDGVLNGGESWMARRKALDSTKSAGATAARGESGNTETDSKEPDIREEEEVPHGDEQVEKVDETEPVNDVKADLQHVERSLTMVSISSVDSATSEDAIPTPGVDTTVASLAAGPPPGLSDVTNVEWLYIDLEGKVQGPFTSDLMQTWFDGGYFTPDLLMKRKNIDHDWIPLAELGRHSSSAKLFSPSSESSHSTGFMHGEEPPSLLLDQTGFKGSFQPVPSRSLRAATLDSYLSAAPNSSELPTSTFGVGRYNSPEGLAFGGPHSANPLAGDLPIGNRISGFTSVSENQPAYAATRRGSVMADQLPDQALSHVSSLGNIPPPRAPPIDTYNFNNTAYPPWPSPNNHGAPGFEARTEPVELYPSFPTPGSSMGSVAPLPQGIAFTNLLRGHENPLDASGSNHALYAGADYGGVSDMPPSRTLMDERNAGQEFNSGYTAVAVGNGPLILSPGNQPLSPSPSMQFATNIQHQQTMPANPAFEQLNTQSSLETEFPWNTQFEFPVRRPGPFDPTHPTSSNTTVIHPISVPPHWSVPDQTSKPNHPPPAEAPPWFKDVVENHWNDVPDPINSAVGDVSQHNYQELGQIGFPALSPISALLPTASEPPSTEPSSEPPIASVLEPKLPASSAPKARQKPAPQQAAASVTQAAPSFAKDPASTPVPQVKPAWSKDDEAKVKPSGAVGLREIQEAEAKRAEAKKADARKTAEKEREKAARSAAPPIASEDVQSFITSWGFSTSQSWGLPTSQAGARSASSQKDPPASTPNASTTPWTAAKTQQMKKSMKQIQEEEERKKKTAVKETAATTARKALENISKPVGNPWTTVGPGGKAALLATVPTRPAVPTLNTGAPSASVTRVNGAMSTRLPQTSAGAKVQPLSKPDETVVSPTHEFLKWLTDSLKGLNSSVNFEEIMSMLLSFPIDADASTTEIISDLIYSNSTTLDGRRFASEFITRRKADAASRPKGVGTSGAGKPISIADVVKAQPKPTQPEWSGFKVVNKKKRGGRT